MKKNLNGWSVSSLCFLSYMVGPGAPRNASAKEQSYFSPTYTLRAHYILKRGDKTGVPIAFVDALKRINQTYGPAGIQIAFDPIRDVEYRDYVPGESGDEAPALEEVRRDSLRYYGKVPIYKGRWSRGSDWNYIMADSPMVAHELAHTLGLAHPFHIDRVLEARDVPDGTTKTIVAELVKRDLLALAGSRYPIPEDILERGTELMNKYMDGDGIADTPPAIHLLPTRCQSKDAAYCGPQLYCDHAFQIPMTVSWSAKDFASHQPTGTQRSQSRTFYFRHGFQNQVGYDSCQSLPWFSVTQQQRMRETLESTFKRHYLQRHGTRWNGWSCRSPSDGTTNAAFNATVFDGKLYLFAKGINGDGIYFRTAPISTPNAFGKWESIPGQTRDSVASVVYKNRLYIFATSLVGQQLWMSWVERGQSRFSGWSAVPGSSLTAKAIAATVIDGRIRLFATRDADGRTFTTTSKGDGVFENWTEIGGTLTSAPSAAAYGDWILLVGRGSDGRAWHANWKGFGVPTGWSQIQGPEWNTAVTDPAAIAGPTTVAYNDSLYVFTTKKDKLGQPDQKPRTYVNIANIGEGFNAWMPMGENLDNPGTWGGYTDYALAPVVVNNRLYVFAVGPQNQLCTNYAEGI